jgi:hypothetical protein
MAATSGLCWFHVVSHPVSTDVLHGADLLLTTRLPEMAEGILRRLPVFFLDMGSPQSGPQQDPGEFIRRVRSPADLRDVLLAALDGQAVDAVMSDEEREAFLKRVYGPADGSAARRVLDVVKGNFKRR